jgi:polysaccharide biosynthesis/export protein
MIEKNNLPFHNWHLPFFFLIVIGYVLSSCVSQRDMKYLQHAGTDIVSFDEALLEDYLLKPNDDLFIQISSLDDVSSNIFAGTNAQQSMQMGAMQAYGASLVAYTIDRDGFLYLPVVGKLYVKGKSLAQVSLLIEESLNNVLSQPVVTVKLVNRYVSVLGEVRNPGHFPYSKAKMTIFDVLGLAGDVTVYGNRKQVILTRNEAGENSRICLDLTKSDILSSEYYFIRPNDIVYVQPLQKRFWGLREFPYMVVLSSITTALLIYNVVIQ